MVTSIIAPMNANGITADAQATHDAAMAAKADADGTNINGTTGVAPEVAPAVTPRPENIPEKFWNAEKGEVNVEALLKSQQDAEAALRAKTEPKKEGEGDTPAPQADETSYDKAVANASAEFTEKGDLSDATYESLAKVGLSRDMVTDYIEGQQAIVTALQTAAFSEFDGSKENYDAAVSWALDNLNESEIKAIDVQITSRNPGVVKAGAAALAAKYAADADLAPTTTVVGGGNSANSGTHFKSGAEMQAAMGDPRYKRDPSFRAEVSQKIGNAERAGVNLFV